MPGLTGTMYLSHVTHAPSRLLKKGEVPGVFHVSGSDVEFRAFTNKEVPEGASVVVALVDLVFLVKQTGKLVTEEDEAHVWRFNETGKVRRFRHCADTFQPDRACQE